MRRFTTVLCFLFSCIISFADIKDENKIIDAVQLINEGEGTKAIKILSEIQNNDAAYYYLYKAYALTGDFAKAGEYIKKAAKMNPGNYFYRYEESSVCDLSESEAILEKLTEDFPEKSQPYKTLIYLLLVKNDTKKASEVINKFERVFGRSRMIVSEIVQIAVNCKNYEFAYKYLSNVNNSKSVENLMYSAVLANLCGKYDEAIDLYKQGLAIDKNNSDIIAELAGMYLMNNDYDLFLDYMQKYVNVSTTVNSTFGKIIYNLIVNMKDTVEAIYKSNPDAADKLADSIIGKFSDDKNFVSLVSEYYNITGRIEKYAEILKKNGDIYKWVEIAYNKLGMNPDLILNEISGLDPSGTSYQTILSKVSMLEKKHKYSDMVKILKDYLSKTDNQIEKKTCVRLLFNILYFDMDTRRSRKEAVNLISGYINETGDLFLTNYYINAMIYKNKNDDSLLATGKILSECDNGTYISTYAYLLYLRGDINMALMKFKEAMMKGAESDYLSVKRYIEVLRSANDDNTADIYENLLKKLDK